MEELEIKKRSIFCIVAVLTLFGCSTSNDDRSTAPILTTTSVSSITVTGAISGGIITSDGGSGITARGVVWSALQNPTIALATKTVNGTGTGTYTSTMNGLSANTTYYLRAYAANSVGTAYGNEVSFTTYQIAVLPSVTIGTQIWGTTNLDVTTYTDGTVIPQVTDPIAWANLTTGAWCYYDNDSVNGSTYDKLYNWYAIAGIYDTVSLTNAVLRKQLAPQGWHIPSDAEWTTLTAFLGGNSVAGGKMKATTGWNAPNEGATNSSGFTGLPGGWRENDGTFGHVGSGGNWWSSSEDSPTYAWSRNLDSSVGNVGRNSTIETDGYSVRCLRD